MKSFILSILSVFLTICIGNAENVNETVSDSIQNQIYFKWNKNESLRDSLVKKGIIHSSKYSYPQSGHIKLLPPTLNLPMYEEGDEDKFRFLFNDPHYSAEKRIVSAIVLQGQPVENEIIDNIRYITLDTSYAPLVSTTFMPKFAGGYNAMVKYLNNNIKLSAIPKDDKQWASHRYVVVCFVVETDGSLTNIKIIDSFSQALDYEAYRLIKNMPKWTAGQKAYPKQVFVSIQLIFNKDL